MKNLPHFDIIKICGYVTTFGTGLAALLPTTGLFPENQVSHVCGVLALVTGIATLVANTLKNPSPPDGSVSANIPKGTIPVVGFPTDAGGQQAAVVAPAIVATNTVRQLTPEPQAPP